MTAPGGNVGRAYIRFDADTSHIEPELDAALHKAADDADVFLNTTGQRWGKTVSESTSKEIEHNGPSLARSMERGLEHQVVRLGGLRFKLDRNGMLHDFDTGQFAGKIVQDIEQAFTRASGPGGPFSKIGEGISDAIGSGFNISGKSPLIAVLVPAIGAIAGLITAAVQAVNALIAVLVQVPGLLIAIGLQAGTLMLAFHGVHTAIQGAFAAKNAEELQNAIKGLTPAAQSFVKSLLPIRDFFKAIQYLVQQNFFTALGDSLTKAFSALGPTLYRGLPLLATALGGLFGQLAAFFGSPAFVDLVHDLIPATVAWLSKFGPGFVSLLTAVVKMADAAIPALSRLGDIVGSGFAMFTSWLNEQIQSGNLTQWLQDMGDTLELVKDLFFQAAFFVASFLDALNKNGGNDVIKQFSELFSQLGMFFTSPAGQAAMAGFVHLVEALTYAFSGLIFTLLGVLIGFEAVLQFFQAVGAAFEAFIGWLTGTAGPAIGTFFTETLPGFFESLRKSIVDLWGNVTYYIQSAFGVAVDWVQRKWDDFTDWLAKKVAGVVSFFTGLPDRLADIGRSIMQGLKDGLQWGWDHTVGPILKWITSQIPSWKGPEEKDMRLLKPAGKAVMQGFGEGLKAGAQDVKDMLTGFTNAIQFQGTGVANNTFNANLNFMGQAPTESQARTAGTAVSGELNRQVAASDTRLAIRMA